MLTGRQGMSVRHRRTGGETPGHTCGVLRGSKMVVGTLGGGHLDMGLIGEAGSAARGGLSEGYGSPGQDGGQEDGQDTG